MNSQLSKSQQEGNLIKVQISPLNQWSLKLFLPSGQGPSDVSLTVALGDGALGVSWGQPRTGSKVTELPGTYDRSHVKCLWHLTDVLRQSNGLLLLCAILKFLLIYFHSTWKAEMLTQRERETEKREREREIFHPLLYPTSCNTGSELKPEAQSSLCVFQMCSRYPSIWAIFCYL